MTKLYTAKQAIAVVSEALEAFGGAGYIEDTGLPHLLRDAQVLAIWEGTTNVLSLDVLRAIRRENALEPFLHDMLTRLNHINLSALQSGKAKMLDSVNSLKQYSMDMVQMSDDEQQIAARNYAFCLTQVYAGGLLLEHAQWSAVEDKEPQIVSTALRWCSRDLTLLLVPSKEYQEQSKGIALDTIKNE